MEKYLFLVFLITILLSTAISPTIASTSTTPYRLKLIHHGSLPLVLPYYETDSSIEGDPHDMRADILSKPEVLLFLVNISIGNPPLPLLLGMDTGSSLLWIKCNSSFTGSSTYINNYCNSSWCDEVRGDCDSQEECMYVQTYVDKSSSKGMLANETFIVRTSDDGLVNIRDVVFGCGKNNRLTNGKDGVLGLGAGKLSAIRQLQITRFSYCLGNVRDPYYSFNQLILGGDADLIEGISTPLEIHNTFYYLMLEGISVGDKRLDISSEEFVRNNVTGHGGVIIDSGASYSYLTRLPLNLLKAEIDSYMDNGAYWLHHPNATVGSDFLCYNGVVVRDIDEFPAVKFHFAGGLDLVLDVDSLFDQVNPTYYCVAIGSSEENGLENENLIGLKAQQFHNIVYDLEQMKVSMERMDCSYLQD